MNKEPKDNPLTSLPIAAVMLITETLQAIAETDPALTDKLIKRFKALADSPIGEDNPTSLELVALITKEMEAIRANAEK